MIKDWEFLNFKPNSRRQHIAGPLAGRDAVARIDELARIAWEARQQGVIDSDSPMWAHVFDGLDRAEGALIGTLRLWKLRNLVELGGNQ